MARLSSVLWPVAMALAAVCMFRTTISAEEALASGEHRDEVILLRLHYSEGTIYEEAATIVPGFVRRRWDCEGCRVGGYMAKIYGDGDQVLHQHYIGDPSIIFYDYSSETGDLIGGMVKVEDKEFVIRLPVIPGMKRIQTISPEGDVVFSRSITEEKIAAMRIKGRLLLWDCETIIDNGPTTNRLDLVILGDGYRDVELSTYHSDVDTLVDYLFSTVSPYKEYVPYFNVHRVDVISEESGADHPESSYYVNTALDASYMWDGVTLRLLYCSAAKAWTAAESAPSADEIIVVVNDDTYGGGGGGFAVGYHGSAMNSLISHEFGHSFGRLMDEYSYGTTGDLYFSGANCEYDFNSPNPKWMIWLDHPEVGWFSECSYTNLGRPTDSDCNMRALMDHFCVVCREQLVRDIYDSYLSTLIEDTHPDSTDLTMAAGDTTLFAIDKLTCPYTEVKWYVNDSLQISAAADSFVFVASDTGISEVRVAILDTTPMLRRDPPPLLASGSQHTWTVTVDVWAGLIADQIDTSFDMIVSRVAPTPFSASVRIAFWLFGDEAVCADIYDIKGKLVAPVLKKMLGKGHHVLTWKARDSHGNAVPPGIYFCRLQAGATVSTSKVVLVR